MNGNLASMSSTQMERNRYVMMSKFRRSMSVESGNFIRISNHRQSIKMNGTCQTGNSALSSPRESILQTDVTAQQRRHRITINVSGEKYQTYKETLERFPKTLLGDPARRKLYFEEDENEYFFDRDRHAFAAIIHFYQSDGQVYCPLNVPVHVLVSEIKFFELGQDALNQALDNEGPSTAELPKNRLQREIWKLFEIPESGIAANLLTIFSVLIIIFSVVILCIETLPHFKGIDPMTKMKPFSRNNFPRYPSSRQPMFRPPHLPHFMKINQSAPYMATFQKPAKRSMPQKKAKNTNWLKIFELCETGIVAWFTLEFLVRLLSCPNKLEFLKSCMNIIDLLAICPYYITLAFDEHGLGLNNIRIIRLVRVFRIFKLSRHSRGLQILGLTLKASIQELGLLIFFLFIGVILFSSAIYYVEEQTFQSIPDAFWWAIITMCTVGYGDKVSEFAIGQSYSHRRSNNSHPSSHFKIFIHGNPSDKRICFIGFHLKNE